MSVDREMRMKCLELAVFHDAGQGEKSAVLETAELFVGFVEGENASTLRELLEESAMKRDMAALGVNAGGESSQ